MNRKYYNVINCLYDWKNTFDSDFLASLLRVVELDPLCLPATTYPLLETLVHGELRKLIGWSEMRATLHHFGTRDQDEVDFVLEDNRCRIVGITPAQRFLWLAQIERTAGERFVRGLILDNHDRITPDSNRIHGAPLSVLWTA